MAERGLIFKDDFVTAPDKSWFDMSFDFLLSGNFGELIPTTCMECMPEDKIHAKTDSFVRLAPLVSPTFGKVNMFDYHFYVRNRSIWTQWESFIADKDQRKSWQQANPLWTPPEMPYIDVRKVLYDSLFLTATQSDILFKRDDAIGNYIPIVFNGYDSDVDFLYLTFEFDSDDRLAAVHSGILITTTGYFDSRFTILIPFIRNKNEQYQYPHNIAGKYNPFSNGTLLDYLGVDLSGLLSTNPFNVDTQIQELFTYLSALSDVTIPDVKYWPETTPIETTWPEYRTSSIQPISLNVYEFLRTHVIYGIATVGGIATDNYSSLWYDNVGNLKGYKVSDGSLSTISSNNPKYYFDSETSKINALPLRAYHSIYIDYFRDQNYISVNPCIDFSRDGDDVDYTQTKANIFDYLTLNYKAYEHDPYTSALPQAQRGEPVRFLPDASIKNGDSVSLSSGTPYSQIRITDSGVAYTESTGTLSANVTRESIIVDLSAATIENLRFANALQKLKEREARCGGRYFELMEAIFGARIDDAKIDRPIFLGGDKTPIQVSEVLQTSATEVNTDQPLGQMAGRAVAIGNDDFIEYVTPDHGFFIEICAVLPRTNYQQGLLPMFTRKFRLDYPMPQFAQLGETQVPQSELWYSADENEDKRPFGYQSRYYDSKYQRDRTSGTFKDALAHWTWSRIFDNAPVAGQAFIEVHPDYRQFAVTDKSQEHLYIHMWHDIQVLRALPVFGTPKL